jgi:hypothetical protein
MTVAMLALAGLQSACANKNTQDFNDQQAAEEAAKAAREVGHWNGILNSKNENALAAVSIDIQESVRGEANNQGIQQVGLRGTITLTPAFGKPLQHGFAGGFYDSTNRAFHISTDVVRVDGSKSSIELHGSFTDATMTGEVWAGQFGEDYEGQFDLRRNGPLPSSSAISTTETAGGHLILEAAKFDGSLPNPTQPQSPTPMEMTFLADPDPEKRFLAYFEPIVYMNVQLHFIPTDGTIPNPRNDITYKAVQIDSRTAPTTFTGVPDQISSFCTFNCTQGDSSIWNCTLCGTPLDFKLVTRGGIL